MTGMMDVSGKRIKQTNNLIRVLSMEARGFEFLSYEKIRMWGLGHVFLISALFAMLLPFHEGLSIHFFEPVFMTGTVLWFLIAVVSLNALLKQTVKGVTPKLEMLAIGLLLGLMFLAYFATFEFSAIRDEFIQEMDWYRGRCGPIIFVTSIFLASGFSYYTVKRLAPLEPGKSAFWTGLASGATSSFLMQFVCAHENLLHILIWHVTPIALFSGLTVIIGQKLFRW